jgi:hypothetical protein
MFVANYVSCIESVRGVTRKPWPGNLQTEYKTPSAACCRGQCCVMREIAVVCITRCECS